jgi:RimJ/RimL family protein N-acetyltransferase
MRGRAWSVAHSAGTRGREQRQKRTTALQHEGTFARARARQVRGYCDDVPEGATFGLLTERLRLRLPVPSDVEVVRRIHQDPAAVAHNPSDTLATRDAAEDLLRLWLHRWQRDGVGYWMVTGHDDPAVVGFCGVKPMRLAEAAVLNLFYRFDPAAWGRGLATEAVSAVVDWVVRIRPDQQLVARIRPGNTASVRVATKAGLVRAAELDTDGEDGPDQIWVLPAPHAR